MTTEFRKGLPSKTQVKAHEANGGLWEDRGPHASVSGCYFHLDSDVITTDDGVTPMTGSSWDDDSYRPLKTDRTPLDWESLTVILPAGTRLDADPDLQALYAIVDGAPGPAPIPVDVEEEWSRRVDPDDRETQGDWKLRRAGEHLEVFRKSAIWSDHEPRYGQALLRMRDILDTVAAARRGSTATITSQPVPDLDRHLDSLTQTLTLIREQDRARKRVCEDLEKRVRDLQAQVVAAIERAEKAEAKVRALEGVGQAKAGEGRFRNLEID